WAATPRGCRRSQAATTAPSTPPSRRAWTGSTRGPPPTPSAFRSGPSWAGTSPSRAESWVSAAGGGGGESCDETRPNGRNSGCRSDHEAEEAVGVEDV
ncbi:unnamed protein product, partial [Tetraodon nigroviridis]